MTRPLALLALLATACAAPVLEPTPCAGEREPVVEASASIDEAGGLVSVREGDRFVYLSVPAGAVPSARRVLLTLAATSTGYLVASEPAMPLERAAELRLEPAGETAVVLVEGVERETRRLPGAQVVRLDVLGEVIEVVDAVE